MLAIEALSNPLHTLTTLCTPTGIALNNGMYRAYTGLEISPLLPESIIPTISRASSVGGTTGARNMFGVAMPAKREVSSCPGVTMMVLMFFAEGCREWASSAFREEWRARRAALVDVYDAVV